MATGEYIPTTDDLELASSRAAAFYMESGTEHVDRQFGAGYAKAHPELVGAFMTAAATIYSANHQAERIKNVGAALDGIANSVVASGGY
jgi:hypothetical protein